MPTYVAVNLQRLPIVAPGEVDVYGLAVAVQTLSTQVDSLSKQVAEHKVSPVVGELSARVELLESGSRSTPPPSASIVSTDEGSLIHTSTASSANIAVCQSGELEIMNQRKPPPAKIRVRGSASTKKIKAVPRVPTVAAFVGRLNIDTTEQELTEMLEQAGVTLVKCSKLKQKPDAKYAWKTAAFFVSCEESCQDILYNEATWPEGAELRDWYFKNGRQ